MLGSDVPAKDYQFTNNDFDGAVAELLQTYADEPTEPAKLVHSIDTTPLSAENAGSFSPEELSEVEARIHTKLSTQLDDFLGEHMAQLSEDLKAWISTAIKNELSDYKKTAQ